MAETNKCLARSNNPSRGFPRLTDTAAARRMSSSQAPAQIGKAHKAYAERRLSMSTQHARPWPAIDVAELRYGLAFGSSVEEIADFLQRDVDDVRHQIEVQVSPRPNR